MRAYFDAAPFAVILSAAAMLLAVPAAAAGTETCAAAPAKLRAMASTQTPDVQKKALRNIDLGQALCDARNRADAAKKFNLAAKAMGTDLATVLAGGATASAQ